MPRRAFLLVISTSVLAAAHGATAFGANSETAYAIVTQVQATAMSGNLAGAAAELQAYRAARGVTPEYMEALSWVGRAQLSSRQTAAAEANAAEVRRLCETELAHRKPAPGALRLNLDAEPHLPIALGASIEVQAQALGMENSRDEAVLFLRDELIRWQGTSIVARIQKNVNLLTLEGKPAPVLDVAFGIGDRKPLPLSAHRGHPVLLFLWAHWCVDCKAEAGILRQLMSTYGSRGLELIAPTRHYGYVAEGKDASLAVETKYISEVFAKYYSGLGKVEVPVSEENFKRFGVSTTPTIVLLDGQGIVRLYNPGGLSYPALAAKVEPLFSGR